MGVLCIAVCLCKGTVYEYECTDVYMLMCIYNYTYVFVHMYLCCIVCCVNTCTHVCTYVFECLCLGVRVSNLCHCECM